MFHETQVQDDPRSQQELQRRDRTTRRQMVALVREMIKKSGYAHGAFKCLGEHQGRLFNWNNISPCPISEAIALLKFGGDVQGARGKLASHAELFDAVTVHPIFELVQQKMMEGNRNTHQQMSEHLEDLELEHEQQQQLMHSHDTAFMKQFGLNLCQSHGNHHDVQCAIAHRHLLLDIVQLIDQGKISSALIELKDAHTCEKCRNPCHPAWKWVDGRPIRSAKEQEEMKQNSINQTNYTTGTTTTITTATTTATAPSLHPLLQTICTVLDVVALQMDTTSLVMLHRTCRHACDWHPDIPIWVEKHLRNGKEQRGEEERYGLATRLALSYRQQKQQQQAQLDTKKKKQNSSSNGNVPYSASKFCTNFLDGGTGTSIMCNNYNEERCDNRINEVHEFTVDQRRKKLVDMYNTCEGREDVLNKLLEQEEQKRAWYKEMRYDFISFQEQEGENLIKTTLLNFIMGVDQPKKQRMVDNVNQQQWNKIRKQWNNHTMCGSKLTDDDERHLLCFACETNNYQAVHFFMFDMGFIPCVNHDFQGTTPLHAAAVHCNLRIMKLLCTDGRIGASLPMSDGCQSILDKEGKSVLDVAIENGHVVGVQWLIEECGWNLDHHNSNTYLNWSLRWTNVLHESLKRCPEKKRGEMSILLKHYGIVHV